MNEEKTLVFYLEPDFRERAEAGKINFINKVVRAFRSRGFAVAFRGNSDAEIVQSAVHPGYALYHMEEPISPRGLTMRLAYFYPFWRIERTGRRWEWEVAQSRFDPDAIDPEEAAAFTHQWRNRLFGAPDPAPRKDGHVYIPLQGMLTEHRSFQTKSPIDMIKATLAEDPKRKVVLGLHPREVYSKVERAALDRTMARHPRLSLSERPAIDLVRGADYLVTQNSGVALSGFFQHRPAILFGQIDFHHIAANVGALGVAEAFRQVGGMAPDYNRYLLWFLQKMSINAGREDAEQQVLDTVRARGWQV